MGPAGFDAQRCERLTDASREHNLRPPAYQAIPFTNDPLGG
jgi:hypothetical protein